RARRDCSARCLQRDPDHAGVATERWSNGSAVERIAKRAAQADLRALIAAPHGARARRRPDHDGEDRPRDVRCRTRDHSRARRWLGVPPRRRERAAADESADLSYRVAGLSLTRSVSAGSPLCAIVARIPQKRWQQLLQLWLEVRADAGGMSHKIKRPIRPIQAK